MGCFAVGGKSEKGRKKKKKCSLIVDFDRLLHVAKPASLGVLVDVFQPEVRPRVGIGQVRLEHLQVDLDRFVVDVINVLGDDGQLVLFPLLVRDV